VHCSFRPEVAPRIKIQSWPTVAALDTGISLAQLILTNATHHLLISPDSVAFSNIIKPGHHPGQPFSLSFRQTADNLLSLNRDLKIQIVWVPQDRSLHGFARAKHLTNTIAPARYHPTTANPTPSVTNDVRPRPQQLTRGPTTG
jgi:hypothetical protein